MTARRRWGVVLLFDAVTTAEIHGLRRALGSPMLERVPPHITLVPPVNVRSADVGPAMDALRAAGAAHRPVSLRIGPAVTFAPVTPVLYLGVHGGAPLAELAARCRSGPLDRPQQFPYVPHVTLHEEADDELISAGIVALRSYVREVVIDRLWVLQQEDDRVWRPLADVELGRPVGRGRGGVHLSIRRSTAVAPDTAALVGVRRRADDLRADDRRSDDRRPDDVLVHEASSDGMIVGAAVSRRSLDGTSLMIEALVVDAGRQGEGVGRQLLVAVADDARAAGATELCWEPPAADEPHVSTRAYDLAASMGFAPDERGRWRRSV